MLYKIDSEGRRPGAVSQCNYVSHVLNYSYILRDCVRKYNRGIDLVIFVWNDLGCAAVI